MKNPPLVQGTLVSRFQRFLAKIRLQNGKFVTATCNNTGSMRTCSEPGSPVMLSVDNNPNRKYPYTWELIQVDGVWVCVNTFIPNRLVHRALKKDAIPELTGYQNIQTEVKYGENSRVDLLLSRPDQRCYVEVKSVTMVENGVAYFPDAMTTRGLKHLQELTLMVEKGHRAVMFFVIQRNDAALFKPAAAIDPLYAAGLKQAHERGVEILAYKTDVGIDEIKLSAAVPFNLDDDNVTPSAQAAATDDQ